MGKWELPQSGHMDRPTGVYLQTMNMTEVNARLKKNDLIIIPVGSTFKEAERKILLQTLSYTHNNISKTARILGLSRKTVHNKLRRLDIPDVLKDPTP